MKVVPDSLVRVIGIELLSKEKQLLIQQSDNSFKIVDLESMTLIGDKFSLNGRKDS